MLQTVESQELQELYANAKRAADKFQLIIDDQIDWLRKLKMSNYSDKKIMNIIDASLPRLDEARNDAQRLENEYHMAGGMKPVFVRSRHFSGS